jgi:hypothetical protein
LTESFDFIGNGKSAISDKSDEDTEEDSGNGLGSYKFSKTDIASA